MKDTTNLAYSIDKEVFKEDGADHFTASLSVDNWFSRIECHGETKGEASQMAGFVYYSICNHYTAEALQDKLSIAQNTIRINKELLRERDAKIASLEEQVLAGQIIIGEISIFQKIADDSL